MSPNPLKHVSPDVVIVYPKTGMDIGSAITPPHALLTIAAPLDKKGFNIQIIDQRTDPEWSETLKKSLKAKPICVGITCMLGMQIHFALKAANIIRAETDGKIPIVWGGPHPSILPEQTLASEYVDIVCIGEGEETFAELVDAFIHKKSLANIRGIGYKNGKHLQINKQRELIDVETLLPTPWHLVKVEDYVSRDFYLKNSPRTLDIGQTSRGCPFQCGFCSSACIRQRKWRSMSVEKSLSMIISAVRKFQLNGVWIRDDEFYISKKRTLGICEGIIQNKLNINWYTAGTRIDLFNKTTDDEVALMKQSGAYALKFGVESGSNRILELINKGITWEDTIQANQKANRHGILFGFSLMMGFPTETLDEIDQTISLGQRLVRENVFARLETIGTYTPLPGTPLFDLALENGLKPPDNLEGWIDWDFWEYDLAGKRIPWFNRRDRKKIGNISYCHTVSYALPNLIDSISNPIPRCIILLLCQPLIWICRLRIKLRFFGFAPELIMLKHLREKWFYQGRLRFK